MSERKTHATAADVTEFLNAAAPAARRADGDHEYFVIGFSPRKASLSVYGLWNAYAPDPRFERLGKHKTGAGCLYITRLEHVDIGLLRELAAEAWAKGAAVGT